MIYHLCATVVNETVKENTIQLFIGRIYLSSGIYYNISQECKKFEKSFFFKSWISPIVLQFWFPNMWISSFLGVEWGWVGNKSNVKGVHYGSRRFTHFVQQKDTDLCSLPKPQILFSKKTQIFFRMEFWDSAAVWWTQFAV